jgi:uncharacterized protein (TIGR03083 family)
MYEPMADAEILQWIGEDARALADLAEGHGELEVPECPGWSVDDLLAHIGGFVAGWYPYNLTHDPDHPDIMASVTSGPPMPEGNAERVEYLRTAEQRFLEVAAAADLDAVVWAFAGTAPARYWIHRAASEVGVHRVDMELARGRSYRVPADRATMSCHETICGFWPEVGFLADQIGTEDFELPSGSCSITATDTGVTWLAQRSGDRIVGGVAETAEADVTVAGDAHDLVMWLWGRPSATPVAVAGDGAIAGSWDLISQVDM